MIQIVSVNVKLEPPSLEIDILPVYEQVGKWPWLREAVPNLIINRANIRDKQLWQENFGLKNKKYKQNWSLKTH